MKRKRGVGGALLEAHCVAQGGRWNVSTRAPLGGHKNSRLGLFMIPSAVLSGRI